MRRTVAIVAGPETLLGLDRSLRRLGIRVHRFEAFRYAPIPSERLRRRLRRFGRSDLLLLTSPESARRMIAIGAIGRGAGPERPRRVLAAGPTTARILRAAGIRARWRPSLGTGGAVIRALGRGAPLRIVYPRSDRAGPELGRALARQGHRVLDLVAYRLRPPRKPSRSESERLARAPVLLATSPSALSGLRRAVRPRAFRAMVRGSRLVVLGSKSARSARGHGFRAVRVLPEVDESAVRRGLVQELGRVG